jgi:hypothetical protein
VETRAEVTDRVLCVTRFGILAAEVLGTDGILAKIGNTPGNALVIMAR